MRRTAIILMALVGAATFSLLVWPGMYVVGQTRDGTYRVNRFTGVQEWATPYGWSRLESASSPFGPRASRGLYPLNERELYPM